MSTIATNVIARFGLCESADEPLSSEDRAWCEEFHSGIMAGLADVAAGRTRPAKEVLQEFRQGILERNFS